MGEFFHAKIDTSQVQRLAVRYPEVFVEEAEAVLRLVTARLESAVVRAAPRGVGGAAGLAGSIFGEVQAAGISVQAVVGTPMPYAETVEYGRKPGSFPPVAPIALWAERKLGVAGDEAMSVGFAIARKIFHKGTEGAHMFGDSWKRHEKWVLSMINTIPSRVVRRLSKDSGA